MISLFSWSAGTKADSVAKDTYVPSLLRMRIWFADHGLFCSDPSSTITKTKRSVSRMLYTVQIKRNFFQQQLKNILVRLRINNILYFEQSCYVLFLNYLLLIYYLVCFLCITVLLYYSFFLMYMIFSTKKSPLVSKLQLHRSCIHPTRCFRQT